MTTLKRLAQNIPEIGEISSCLFRRGKKEASAKLEVKIVTLQSSSCFCCLPGKRKNRP